jgi:hypothetical protein
MMRVVVDGAERAFLHVELAKNHGACGSQSADYLCIDCGNGMVSAAKAIGRRDPGNIDVVLGGDGDAVDWAQPLLARGSPGCLLGVCERAIAA